MTHHEIPLPPQPDFETLVQQIEGCCADEGLSLGRKSTLATYPGSTHWHWKCGRERGMLEITLWPAQYRLWIGVHANRRAEWTDAAILRLVGSLVRLGNESWHESCIISDNMPAVNSPGTVFAKGAQL